MELTGEACFLDQEWESLYKIFSDVDPNLDFTHFLGHNTQLPSDSSSPIFTSNPNQFYQSSSTSDLSGSNSGSENYVNTLNHITQLCNEQPFDQFLTGLDDHTTMIERPISSDKIDGPDDYKKRKCGSDLIQIEEDEAPLPKKRARGSKHAEKGKRKMQPKKKDKEEAINVKISSSDASDNESNASREVINEGSNGKKRASRGAATDPQSLYARRRRERINERLKILQTIVPNGTKVDISTMLEEAVNYVKFLQLQIKLLSSDEMWMYAPLAYNGFDVGFYNKFSPYQQWP